MKRMRHIVSLVTPRRALCTSRLTHLTRDNKPTMKSVQDKQVTRRVARAISSILLPPGVASAIRERGGGQEIASAKGPVFATAIIAGTMAVKQTSTLIPFCHPLPIEACKIGVDLEEADEGWWRARVDCTVSVTAKTGVEMEALVGASVSALSIYDMLKSLSQEMVIEETRLLEKTGGKSDYNAGAPS